MTEGMACSQTNASQQEECIYVQEQLDRHLFSWTDYGASQGAVWEIHPLQQRIWARTYAQAIAGAPINMSFDIRSPERPFELCFTLDRMIQAPTEVFASRAHHYPNGLKISASSNLNVTQATPDIWYITPTPESAPTATGIARTPETGCVRMQRRQ